MQRIAQSITRNVCSLVALAALSGLAFGQTVSFAELEANRRFHFAVLDAPDQVHAMRLIRLLWDSTEAYRAMYYNSPEERREAVDAHDRIIDAIRRGDADTLVAELDAHRVRALGVLRGILAPEGGSGVASEEATWP